MTLKPKKTLQPEGEQRQILSRTTAVLLLEYFSRFHSQAFARDFSNEEPEDLIIGFQNYFAGITDEQIQNGLIHLKKMGYFPDMAVFYQWCLGQYSFNFSDEIKDSYRGKDAALAKIKQWIALGKDYKKAPLTVAEKLAYDGVYILMQEQNHRNDYDRATADRAFTQEYTKIVSELVAKRIKCQMYTPPTALKAPKEQDPLKRAGILKGEEADAHVQNLKALLAKKSV